MGVMSLPTLPLTVAAVQARPEPGAVAANAALAARLVGTAADRRARVVVLPELFLCAYHPPTLYAADPASTHVRRDVDGRVDDDRLAPLVEVARARAVTVVIGAAVLDPAGRRTCSALVVGPDGTVSAAYDKQNLWGPDEKALFTPGDRPAAITVDGWRLGLGICYDGCFPEHGRAAAMAGAHAYLCPSGYLVSSEHRRDLYYPARALDNTMYVVFANTVGELEPLRFNGGAAVYEPEGRALAKAPDAGEAVMVSTLDPVELARIRAAHTMLRDYVAGGPA
jgi:predicted amidohydrolase